RVRSGPRVLRREGELRFSSCCCDRLFTGPTDQPRHATEHANLPGRYQIAPGQACRLRQARVLYPPAGRMLDRPTPSRGSPRFAASLLIASVMAQPPVGAVVPLWPGKAPLAVGDSDLDKPSVALYLVPKDRATGAAVVICPGGGYGFLAA